MSEEPRQLVLDLGVRPALGVEDFLVGPSNAGALALVDQWPGWAMAAAMVVGPEGAGKTHLANVWRLRSGAAALSGSELAENRIAELMHAPALLVEDVDRGIGCERTLFHLLNLAREQRTSVLITSSRAPGELSVALPDLRSRLRALAVVPIELPGEAMLRAMLVKLFADRQLSVEPAVIETLTRHMDRTPAAAVRLVAEIDRLSLATRRRVTRALALNVVTRGAEAADED